MSEVTSCAFSSILIPLAYRHGMTATVLLKLMIFSRVLIYCKVTPL